MTTSVILSGARVVGGSAEGEALVTRQQISFMGGVDSATGIVKEKGHELEGQNIKGKVLVFPRGKGSSEGALKLYDMSVQGTAPAAIINVETESIIAVGAILGKIPTIHRLDQDPIEIIRSGDHLKVNADAGTVEIWHV
jgi:predicted aconitase with swiveling domain